MTLYVIPNDIPTLTPGERRILEKLRSLYKEVSHEAYLYVQPRIRNLEPDFILIDSQRGLAVLEVKDWGISYIKQANSRTISLNDGKEVANPLFKTNQYHRSCSGLFNMHDSLLDDIGDLKFQISSRVIFTNLTSTNIRENNLETVFQTNPAKYVSADEVNRLHTDSLFGQHFCSLTQDELIAMRTLLFPEIKITKKSSPATGSGTQELIRALDAEQERFAKRLPYGHYMVTGIPGSGKTVILLARAIHLVREHPEWKIRILTYNNSLKNKLNNSLNLIAEDAKFMGVHLENIEVSTFHKFALDLANVGVPADLKKLPEAEQQAWWNETLPNLAFEKATPMYDAILVDEYQDFYDNWIRVCIKCCETHEYQDNRKENRRGINLFLAGDRLQSIYNVREHSWKEIGVNMQGRSELLKKSYRSGNEHIEMALQFLKQNKSLETEVGRFYSPSEEMSFDNQVTGSVSFLKGSVHDVAGVIHELVYRVGRSPKDILVLCRNWSSCYALRAVLDEELQKKTEVTKTITGNKLVLTTYHSSKGLEAPITFLLDVDKFEQQALNQNDVQQRKLMYVGMTRASERLYIHAADYIGNTYAKQLMDIAPVVMK